MTHIDARRAHIVYGGVDLAPYEAPLPDRAELGLPAGYLIGYVGGFRTLGKEKGIAVMLEALTRLPSEARMAFVGGSSEEIEEYKRRALSLGLEGRSTWVPKQPYEKVAAYERNMDVLVIPYPDAPHFRDFGFPMKAYEYLAAEKPIVYSDLAIMKEVLAGKGIAFTPGDPISLSEAISEARGTAAHKDGAEAFSWDAKAGTILAAIQSAP
jgi:glycosyltransferase involved in cell wall biosynthesis